MGGLTFTNEDFAKLTTEDRLLLAEQPYQSIQGEGRFVGMPMIFLRLQGCNVGCSWCDSYYTWHPFNTKRVPIQIAERGQFIKATNEHIEEEINRVGKSNHVWITGGEPMLQQKGIINFLRYMRGRKKFHICTAGTMFNLELATLLDYITVDVKAPSSKTKSSEEAIAAYAKFSDMVEFKMVVSDSTQDKEFAIEFAKKYSNIPLTLQPLYLSEVELMEMQERMGDMKLRVDVPHGWSLQAFGEWVNREFAGQENVRLGLQLHKHLYPYRSRGI